MRIRCSPGLGYGIPGVRYGRASAGGQSARGGDAGRNQTGALAHEKVCTTLIELSSGRCYGGER